LVCGATVKDLLSGHVFAVNARHVVNATGPFADAVGTMDDPHTQPILTVSSGAHIVLDGRFVPDAAGILIPRTEDGRVLFILPWQGHTLIGTTDERAAIFDHPPATAAEVDYLLGNVNRLFSVKIERSAILSQWSGLRPLAYNPKPTRSAELARDHVLHIAPSGLISIVGGKWTTYRLMSEQTVDLVLKRGGEATRPCRTETMRLFGGNDYDPEGFRSLINKFRLPEDIARHLHHYYGDQADAVLQEGDMARLHADYPYIEAEVYYAMRQEDAEHVIDVLARRLGLAMIDQDAAKACNAKVTALMAAEKGWDEIRQEQERQQMRRHLDSAL
jgi:glycerol-3-phosphate dehydrogenase